ncbi:MAG: HAD-IA family hydrolase [Nitrososphaeraceae archaeon]|jgi:HAD superfamily phosphatase|nr:HAD-IA family hydrolase [Nitrososphaeraceae archaeon]MDW0135008.1 HAD-IA family hydrolase [Nitrososphaeraceae archaeon]
MNSNACIIFDIDGTLIDTRESYNKSIKKTVQFLVKYIDISKENLGKIVSDEQIFKFRKSGMFNNDIDTSYALVLSILCGPPKKADLLFFIENIAQSASSKGIKSVENYLKDYSEIRLKQIKKLLMYPGDVKTSIIARVFDEYFYGPQLFKKQHGTNSKYYSGRPLIENDILLATNSTLKKISNMFDMRTGIVSGRSRIAAEYSLKSVFKFFDIKGSVYLEDEKREMGKPNPSALIKSVKSFGVSNAFYVGDSAEDLFMVQRARKISNLDIKLIGVCASNARSNQIRSLFTSNGTSLIVKNINELPNILNKVKTQF